MKTFNKLKNALTDVAAIIHQEFSIIGSSYSILLVLMGGIFVYGLLYNYMYEPNLVRNAPIALVDHSKSALSREYARLMDATPQVNIYSQCNYPEAQKLMKENKVVGIIFIPHDFESRVSEGQEAIFRMYGTTNAFLYYLALQESSSGAMMALNDRYRPEMLAFLPQADVQEVSQSRPIAITGTALFNFTEGYGSYLIPAVLVVIIFQTLFMVIGMISGEERHSGSIRRFAIQGVSFARVARIILGKTFVYCMLYAVFALFLLGLMPVVFSLPNIGQRFDVVILMIPHLLSTCFFALAASVFFTDSESPLLMIAFFSVGFIFLSGVSYPLELMPWYWRAAHFIVPVAPGTLAFIKLNTMGATLTEIRVEYITLWIQCIIYFILACIAYRHTIRKAEASPPTTK